jgi:GT2 family glycosyltransferase
MFARTERWWEGRYSGENVFDPAMAMTGNEDELQKRWRKKKFRTGFCPQSFIFHYRAVSRGDRFKHRGWYRIDDINKPV